MNRLAPALANLVRTLTCQYETRPNGRRAGRGTEESRTETATCLAFGLETLHVLVPQYRYDRRHGGARPRHFPVVPRLDLRRRLGRRRSGSGVAQPSPFCARVRARGGGWNSAHLPPAPPRPVAPRRKP